MIVALSALLIGLVTAFTSIYSAYVDRAYARASVWPRLELFRSYSGNSFSYGVTNNGTGPALIKYAKVQHDSKFIKHWREVEAFKDITQSHLGNRTLSPQGKITPVLFKGDDISAVIAADKKISIELCYCSIYEECWIIDRRSLPVAAQNCEIDKKQAFQQ